MTRITLIYDSFRALVLKQKIYLSKRDLFLEQRNNLLKTDLNVDANS